MILNDATIRDYCKNKNMVTPYNENQLNPASYDICVGNTLIYKMETDPFCQLNDTERVVFHLNKLILLASKETFNLPHDICAQFALKSSLARKGLFHALAGWCFVRNTDIPLLDGTTIKLGDMQKNKTYWVYSLNSNNKIVPGKANFLGETKKVSSLIEITLDNNKKISCTPEHLFMLKNGSYKQAQNLIKGESLMPLYRKINDNGYEMVYSPYDNDYKFTHRLICNFTKKGIKKAQLRINYNENNLRVIIHHKDFNKRNNSPANLIFMGDYDHLDLHSKLASPHMKTLVRSLWDDPKYEDFRKRHSIRSSKFMTEMNNKNWADPSFREKMAKLKPELGRQTIRKLNSNPDFRKMLNTKAAKRMKNANTDNEMKCSQMKGKILKLYRLMLNHKLNPKKWTTSINFLIKQNLIPKGSPHSYKKYFNSLSKLEYFCNKNHKVQAIKRISCKNTPVYDLHVEKWNNFAISSGVFVDNCDPGWHGNVLTMELINLSDNAIILDVGQPIGQMIFMGMVNKAEKPYNGKYNNDKTVSDAKE